MTATTRPLISDAEWRNGAPALAQLVRKLCRWATFSYERDLVYTPADPKVVVPGAPGAGWTMTPRHTATAGTDGEVIVGVFPVPDALTPARSLDVRFLTSGTGT